MCALYCSTIFFLSHLIFIIKIGDLVVPEAHSGQKRFRKWDIFQCHFSSVMLLCEPLNNLLESVQEKIRLESILIYSSSPSSSLSSLSSFHLHSLHHLYCHHYIHYSHHHCHDHQHCHRHSNGLTQKNSIRQFNLTIEVEHSAMSPFFFKLTLAHKQIVKWSWIIFAYLSYMHSIFFDFISWSICIPVPYSLKIFLLWYKMTYIEYSIHKMLWQKEVKLVNNTQVRWPEMLIHLSFTSQNPMKTLL